MEENVLIKLYNKLNTTSWRKILGDRPIDKIKDNANKLIINDRDEILKKYTIILLKAYKSKVCKEENKKLFLFFKDKDLENMVSNNIFTLEDLYNFPATDRETMFFDDTVFKNIIKILKLRIEI